MNRKFSIHLAIGSAMGLSFGFIIGLIINFIMHENAMSVAWNGGGFNADEMNRYKLIQALSCLLSLNAGAIIGCLFHLSATRTATQQGSPAGGCTAADP